MEYINKNKIIGATILKPYKNECEPWDMQPTRGWQVSLLIGFRNEYPECVLVDKKSEKECLELIQKLNLINL